jgi:hypothetical protein
MSGSVSLAPTNVRHDADRLHPLRRTESDRDLAYLIRTFLRFSAQRERWLSSPTSWAAASREKPGSALSAPTVPAAGCRRWIGCTPRREGSGRPPGDVSRRRSWQSPHADGQEAVSQVPCWRQQRQDGAAVGLATTRPVGSPPTSHTDPDDADLLPSSSPALPVRLLVNRCGSRRSSGDTHGPCLRLPLHCQACQRSLTRKRSLVQIQYRPPVILLVRPALRHIYRLRSSTS